MKKKLRHTLIGILTAVVLLCALPLLVYVPPVQQWLVQKVAAIASDETGLTITVEHVDLDFPLDLGVDGVLVTRQADTIASIGRAVVDVRLLPLLRTQVMVDRLDISQVRMNTFDLISDVQVSGKLGALTIHPSTISIDQGDVLLSEASLYDADVTVLLSDTAAVDTTTTGPTLWRIAFDQFDIERSNVSIHLPGDSLLIDVGAALMQASCGDINLGTGRYAAQAFQWRQGTLRYELPYEPRDTATLDYNHLNLWDINLAIDSVCYQDPLTVLTVSEAAFTEQSGLQLTQLRGHLSIDDKGVKTPGLLLATPYSNIYAKADIDYSVADSLHPGQMDVDLNAQVGKADLQLFLPPTVSSHWPEWPLTLKGRVTGNVEQSHISDLSLQWPTVIDAQLNGTMTHLLDADRMTIDADLQARNYNVQPLLAAWLPSDVSIPAGLSLTASLQADGPLFSADLSATDGDNTVSMNGSYHLKHEAYHAQADITRLNVQHFMPALPLSVSHVQMTLQGQGTDPKSTATTLEGEVSCGWLQYDTLKIDNLHLMTTLKAGHAVADISSQNRYIDGSVCVDGLLKDGHLKADVSSQLNNIDLKAMSLVQVPLAIGLNGDFQINSDLNDTHKMSGLVSEIRLTDSLHTYHPERVGILFSTTPDTTYVRMQSGSLIVKLDANQHYEPLLAQLQTLADSVTSQYNRNIIDQLALKQMLPTTRLYVSSSADNPIAHFLKASRNISFKELLVDLTTSPQSGLNGQAHLFGLNADSTLIDTVIVTLVDKPNHGLTFQGRVANNRKNPQFVFTTLADGLLQEHGASAGLRFFDSQGRMGLRIGIKSEMEDGGIRFHLLPKRPTLGYREFTLNDDNYIFLQNNMRLKANVVLHSDDDTGLRIYSEDQDSTLLQDLTISLHNLELDHLTAAIPYMPRITGSLAGDYHLTMNDKRQISVASDMQVKDMTYEQNPMGTIGTEFVYMQREDDTHAVEATMMQNGREIATISGSYRHNGAADDDEEVDATLTLTRTPLNLINGFIPDRLVGLEGLADGEMSVTGTTSRPKVNGEVLLDSAYLISEPYGIRLRFDNDPVRIQDSKLLLENFTMYAYNDNPLNIMGNIDFSNMDQMTMDVRMRATDYQLINAKQSANSIAYGKAFVNFYAILRGPMDHLRMRGKIDVLGKTDLTYLLLDSPLSTDNQMDELVKFTDFNDTTHVTTHRPTPDALDMELRISIDQGAHVKCGLNADQSNYVDLWGGGDLRMTYNGTESLRLTGRYTLSSGQMKYSLPVIPLKTFTIQDGSYVEFTGDAMNPTLNITATERVTAGVGQEGQQTRNVAFDCGIKITKTLKDLGLQFVITAPDDYVVTTELNTLSEEQRGKLAVTMLTTGLYLADGNTSGSLMNSALSAFLESEINNITGNALKTVDLNVGVDNMTDAAGNSQTNYSFKFAKRFWNNRLKVQIGGKVSTGNEIAGTKQSFFDNVAMEYRLKPTSNQYLKLYYQQNVYDWIDGYTNIYGGGFIWKRKLASLLDLFRSTPANTAVSPLRTDSTRLRTDSTRVRTDTIPTRRKE